MGIIINDSIFPSRLAFNLIGLIFNCYLYGEEARGTMGRTSIHTSGTEPFPVPLLGKLAEISMVDILWMYL